MCWKTYVLSRSKVEVIAPFTMDMHRKKVSACLTDACSSSINEHSRRKGVKSVEVGGENDARGHVPPAKDTQKKSQCVAETRRE